MPDQIIDAELLTLIHDAALSPDIVRGLFAFALREARLKRLMPNDAEFDRLRASRDCLNQFAANICDVTGRQWTFDEIKALWAEVVSTKKNHVRHNLSLESILSVVFNKAQECALCQKMPPAVKLEIDHTRPVSKGGSSKYGNLRLLCQPCNRSKSDKIAKEFGNA